MPKSSKFFKYLTEKIKSSKFLNRLKNRILLSLERREVKKFHKYLDIPIAKEDSIYFSNKSKSKNEEIESDRDSMKNHCKKLGIPYLDEQPTNETDSTHFVNKPKSKNEEIGKAEKEETVEESKLSVSQIQERMRKVCEEAGIPYSQNQRQSGTASIRFINKPKGKNEEVAKAEKEKIVEDSKSTFRNRDSMEKLSKDLNIPFSKNTQQSGTASIHFINKPKSENGEEVEGDS